MGLHALVQLHRFIIPFHSMLGVSVLHSKLFHSVSLSSYVFSLSRCLYSIIYTYLALDWVEFKIQIAASGMVF